VSSAQLPNGLPAPIKDITGKAEVFAVICALLLKLKKNTAINKENNFVFIINRFLKLID
jgi:hypothetical protein